MNDKLNEAILQYSNWFTLSSKEIDTLKADLVELQKGLNCSDAMAVLRNEITNLKNKVQSFNSHRGSVIDHLGFCFAVTILRAEIPGSAQ